MVARTRSADPYSSGESRREAGDRVPTLICTDSGYLQHAAVCLTSLVANNPGLFFDIAIVRRASETLDIAKLRRSLAPFANHTITEKAFTQPPEISLPLNPQAKYTLDSWSRLWVADFFPDDVERVLYLDGDIVVVGSIAELWRTDLDGNVLGCVDIPGAAIGVQRLGLRPEDGYFNSGVLLIDLKQWRETQVLPRLLDYMRVHPEQMVFALDQDALNACLYKSKKRLDPKWNAVWTFFRDNEPVPLPRAAIEVLRRDARIIHFNHEIKPWSYFCEHPRQSEYYRYLRMTEWRDFVPPDRTMRNRLYKFAGAVLPARVKASLRSARRKLPIGGMVHRA